MVHVDVLVLCFKVARRFRDIEPALLEGTAEGNWSQVIQHVILHGCWRECSVLASAPSTPESGKQTRSA